MCVTTNRRPESEFADLTRAYDDKKKEAYRLCSAIEPERKHQFASVNSSPLSRFILSWSEWLFSNFLHLVLVLHTGSRRRGQQLREGCPHRQLSFRGRRGREEEAKDQQEQEGEAEAQVQGEGHRGGGVVPLLRQHNKHHRTDLGECNCNSLIRLAPNWRDGKFLQ